MRIGLIDVDSHHYPNLVQMKLSAYHKARGDTVERVIPAECIRYDRIYMSKVFSFTDDMVTCLNCDDIRRGGTGYAISLENGKEVYHKEFDQELPEEIEHTFPDYSLYGITDTAYGYLTRGCPRACGFCHVAAKEGRCSHGVADLEEFWNGQKYIKLFDPNIFACYEWGGYLEQLAKSNAYVDFTQGIDIRLMDEARTEALKDVRIKILHFAWDRYRDRDIVLENAEKLNRKLKLPRQKIECFVLTNYDTTFEQDMERVMELRKMGIDPYIMIYDKEHLPAAHPLKKLARWVNAKWIWAVCPTFEKYLEVRGTDA